MNILYYSCNLVLKAPANEKLSINCFSDNVSSFVRVSNICCGNKMLCARAKGKRLGKQCLRNNVFSTIFLFCGALNN